MVRTPYVAGAGTGMLSRFSFPPPSPPIACSTVALRMGGLIERPSAGMRCRSGLVLDLECSRFRKKGMGPMRFERMTVRL